MFLCNFPSRFFWNANFLGNLVVSGCLNHLVGSCDLFVRFLGPFVCCIVLGVFLVSPFQGLVEIKFLVLVVSCVFVASLFFGCMLCLLVLDSWLCIVGGLYFIG